MSEWIEWNGGEMPVPKGTMVQLCYRSGDQAICSAGMSSLDLEFKRISGAPYLATRWIHYGDQNDIVKYKIYKEEPKGHPNASILMEIAKEAAINPNPINQFLAIRITDKLTRRACYEDFRLLLSNELEADWEIRRKPRTIRIGNYDVPEFKARKYKSSFSQNSIVVELDDEEHAELMLKALQELLAGKQ